MSPSGSRLKKVNRKNKNSATSNSITQGTHVPKLISLNTYSLKLCKKADKSCGLKLAVDCGRFSPQIIQFECYYKGYKP